MAQPNPASGNHPPLYVWQRFRYLGRPRMYKYLLFVHVLLAIVWVGGGLALLLLGAFVRRTNDAAKVAEYGSWAEWIGTRIYLPSSLLLFVAGAWMVIDGAWSWTDAWIMIGIAGWLFSALIGSL